MWTLFIVCLPKCSLFSVSDSAWPTFDQNLSSVISHFPPIPTFLLWTFVAIYRESSSRCFWNVANIIQRIDSECLWTKNAFWTLFWRDTKKVWKSTKNSFYSIEIIIGCALSNFLKKHMAEAATCLQELHGGRQNKSCSVIYVKCERLYNTLSLALYN